MQPRFNTRKVKTPTLSDTCLKCIEKCAKTNDVTSCVAYEREQYHWRRMMDGDCPLIDKFVDNIFSNIVNHAKAELIKRNISITEEDTK